jgi:GST-like protein
MLKFYFSGAPNPTKIALFLEESGLPYEPIPVDTRKGQQFSPEYIAINPNSKVPAIVDGDAKVFDSNAILLYLAEKTGKFLPPNTPANRGELLSEKLSYAITRYVFEAERHFGILNDHLAKRRYMVGDTYTIVDMDVWGWARLIPMVLSKEAWTKFPHLKRLVDEIEARPAAQRALKLKDRYTFKTENDEESRRHMFRHIKT